jgi:ParB family chromosome partitioning protein
MDRDEKYLSESIFWLEVDRIKPNPYQPRKVFDEAALNSLAESIRQYGVLQPLVVTKRETEIADEGIRVEYELISGERRLRASKIARVHQVPVVIRKAENSDKIKLELAIIENLQREDLNAVDRAKAFKQLIDEFKLSHVEVGKKMGKSREYVSNTLRILTLPEDMQQALMRGDISEGHTRPLLMLAEKKEEQAVLFKEITDKHMTVREAEQIARRIAVERARKADLTPELLSLEKQLTEKLGTRVRIEQKEKGGKVLIDFFSPEDLAQLVAIVAQQQQARVQMPPTPPATASEGQDVPAVADAGLNPNTPQESHVSEEEDDLYSMRNFTV